MITPTKHVEKVDCFAGFAAESSGPADKKVKVLARTALTSNDKEFHRFVDKISSIFLAPNIGSINNVNQFLVLIHKDQSADIYVNNIPHSIEIRGKRDIKKGQVVTDNDIADIRSLKISGIDISESDVIIYCFKVNWKFALFFDLQYDVKLNIDEVSITLGSLFRELSYEYVYEVFKGKDKSKELLRDWWFPYVELIGKDFKKISELYEVGGNISREIDKVVSNFPNARVNKIIDKWWTKELFKERKKILSAGVNSYLKNDEEGFICCIKTLLTEVEGIFRSKYLKDTGKDSRKLNHSLEHIAKEVINKTASTSSLFQPIQFIEFLDKYVYAKFDLKRGDVNLGRHTVSHGVAKQDFYNKRRALQSILILDQVYFYL